jgi:ParB-like chromosome segregation protein Spo0J
VVSAARKKRVEALAQEPTELTAMQHRGARDVAGCIECGSEPGLLCVDAAGEPSEHVHAARFLAVPLNTEIRKGTGIYAAGASSMLPVLPAAAPAPVALPSAAGGNVAGELATASAEGRPDCSCGSLSWATWFVLPDGALMSSWSPEATHERRVCLACGGFKSAAKPLVEKQVVRGEKPAPGEPTFGLDPLSVDCPKCLAKAGAPCWGKRPNANGTGVTHGAIDPHPGRVKRAALTTHHDATGPAEEDQPSPSVSEGVAHGWTEELVEVAALVFDPRLQMRANAVSEQTVSDYAELMKAGTEFPRIKVRRVDGQLLVVDGWQRGHAARKAERTHIPALVRPGTFREALAEAIAANGDHGLQRTNADKNRAVVALLKDPEWCQLSSRVLATMAKVTHTYVNNLRKHYGVKPGEVLTEDAAAEADGVLPERYELIAKGSEWLRQAAVKVRAARDLKALASAAKNIGSYGNAPELINLRLEDLAVNPWPWPDDEPTVGRKARALDLDTVDDLARAILSKDCPDRPALFEAWSAAKAIGRATEGYEFDRLERKLKGRKGLLKALKARRKEVEAARDAEEAGKPTNVARKLAAGEPDDLLSAIAMTDRPELLGALVDIGKELPAVGQEALRVRLARDGLLVDCPDVSCGGFAHKHKYAYYQRCWKCRKDTEQSARDVRESVAHANRLLLAGVPVRAGEVVIDRPVLRAVSELEAAVLTDRARCERWVSMAPSDLQPALLELLAALAAPERRAPEAQDLAPEEDGEDEDLGEDEDGALVNTEPSPVNTETSGVNTEASAGNGVGA